MLFLHFLDSIQAAPLITFEESVRKCLFVVKALLGIFFGVSLLVFGRNLSFSGKVTEKHEKTRENRAIYCVVGFYVRKVIFRPKGEDLAIEKCRRCDSTTF